MSNINNRTGEFSSGVGSDCISLSGYVELSDIVNWHINNNRQHVLRRDNPALIFDVETRTKLYDIKKYINSNTKILDFGCSTGLFGFHLCNMIQNYTGVDFNYNQIEKANYFKKKNNINNCNFLCETFSNYFTSNYNDKFDYILFLAVTDHIKTSLNINNSQLIKLLKSKMNLNGYILIEGGPIRTKINNIVDANYENTWLDFYNELKNDVDLYEEYTKFSREKRYLHLFKKIK